jgi:hypothetical protein
MNGLAVPLKCGLARYAENVADLLPRPASSSRMLHRLGQQHVSVIPDLLRRPHQRERIELAVPAGFSEDLTHPQVKVLHSHHERTDHSSRLRRATRGCQGLIDSRPR